MDVLLELPESLRGELKDPLGPIFTEADTLLSESDGPVIAVGDIVTYHLLQADARPDVALIDGKTKRERVEREVLEAIDGFDHRIEVENPPATLTEGLLLALREAVARKGTTVIEVIGEEDLAALPAVLVAPLGASIVYGQPDEGMVHALVTAERRERVRFLLGEMVGDHDRVADLLAER
ncbi:GTP-dependent dephospho-CoA kinase family protein [Natronomonas sp. EA1]|uniref:GTP-dependent dephospho-CoA kinase family protein n=1 Tax=Natronomonas sp. EA1 TaxID=3421655 RepID=UPI003EBAA4F1